MATYKKLHSVKGFYIILAINFVVIFAAWAFISTKYPQFLYLYRDGEYNLWISLQSRLWSDPFAFTSFNPLQGMTSMLVTVNPYFNPGQWVFFTNLSENIKVLSSYTVYGLEIFISSFFLSITLGFSRIYSAVAAAGVILILFPPFNFFFGLAGWMAVYPMLGHTLSLSNVCLILYLKIGKSFQSTWQTMLKNITYFSLLVLLILLILYASPFYNAGLLLGTGILFGIIILSSVSKKQFLWRLLTVFSLIAIFYSLKVPEFYSAAKNYSARFQENQKIIEFHWNAISTLLDKNSIANIINLLCGFGIFCQKYPGWPISVSTIWFNLAIIMGGLVAWKTLPLPRARIGLLIALFWIALILTAILLSTNFLVLPVEPLWFYLMSYSMITIYGLQLLVLPNKILKKYLKIHFTQMQNSIIVLALVSIVFGWIAYSFHKQPTQMSALVKSNLSDQAIIFKERHPVTPIIQILKDKIALYPGSEFHGLVATIINGPHEQFLNLLKEKTGSSHDLLDLWSWNIPTLSEYGQGLSRPLVFYSKFLHLPEDDSITTHFFFPYFANIEILKTLGVRFIIVDKPLTNNLVLLRHQLKDVSLYLYEIVSPNLGHYSPTQLKVLKNSTEFYQEIESNPKILEKVAYVTTPINIDLVPATHSKIVFQKNSIHVTAESTGQSAILLPIQFSNCYRAIENPNSEMIKIMRANLIHTLIVFNKKADVLLKWEFRLGKSQCRQVDAKETASIL